MVADFLQVTVTVGMFDGQRRNTHVVAAHVHPRADQLNREQTTKFSFPLHNSFWIQARQRSNNDVVNFERNLGYKRCVSYRF